MIQEVGEIERSFFVFDNPAEKLEDISWFQPITGSLSLLLHPELFDVGLDFDPTRTRAGDRGKRCRIVSRLQRPAIRDGPGSILRK